MDVSKLKMKQLAEVEELSGYNMDEWETCPKVKLTMAIAFVLGKMSDPELTWEKVENMSIDEMQNISGDIEAPKANNS
jgi:hypothetical protein